MVFEYSYGWILPAILLALAVAYFKFKKLSTLPDIATGMVLLISGLRFLVVFTLLFFLLNPSISILHQIKEKPLFIVAQDNSVSVVKSKDSVYYQHEYRESLENTVNKLQEKYEVVRLTFGESVHRDGKIDFSENCSDIAEVIDYANHNFVSRPPAGMLLLTDGIYNTGVNPRYKIPSFPIYTIGLGDTTRYPDIYIRTLETNKFNFLNTIFPLRVEIAALKQKGEAVKCLLRENGNVIAEKSVQIDQNNFLTDILFEIEAKQKGINRYDVTLETKFTEQLAENKKATTWVHIIDNSARVAVFAAVPHPDIAAIVNAIQVSGIYHCQEHHFNEDPDTLQANLILLHNPDIKKQQYLKLLQYAGKKHIPIWYILTNKKTITDLVHTGNHYHVNFSGDLNEYATVGVNPSFPYFEFTEQEMAGYKAYPPLIVPFGEINTKTGQVLFTQSIKHNPTPNGLMAFYETEGNRIAYFWGEGLWRWRLYSYQETGSHQLFNTLINKIVGYLAAQKGNERFIHDIKPVYGDMEEAIIAVELYNDSYELVNYPEVELTLGHEGKIFSYSLNRNGDKYRINLGNLPAGEYTYQLSTDLKGEVFVKKGVFYVRRQNIELNHVVADFQLLNEIAETTGGQLTSFKNRESLVQLLLEDHKQKPLYKSEAEFIDLSRIKISGLILLLLLCIEWFLLKFFAD